MPRPAALLPCLGALPAAAQLPPYTTKLRDELWKEAQAQVKNMAPGDYVGQEKYSCSSGTWGDGPQCNQWDSGFSPCWPSAMTISAAWDVELMGRWSREMAMEFGAPNRGQLAPGVNIARYPWNGRLGEYMSGEDPYFGARMVEKMVTAYRDLDRPPLQTVKHFIPNTIETGRMDGTEVVDERTLFEVYYPAFQAAVDAGMSAVMCSYNLVQCTSGLCNVGRAYACANHDILVKHLKGVMGFKGIVISDWDATKCQATAAKSGGCAAGSYIDGNYAATGGLDLEMPACASLSGGFTNATVAADKAARTRWAYLVQGRDFDATETGENRGWFSDDEAHAEPAAAPEASGEAAPPAEAQAARGEAEVTQGAGEEAPAGAAEERPRGAFCCFWASDEQDSCATCQSHDGGMTEATCAVSSSNVWCRGGKAGHKSDKKRARRGGQKRVHRPSGREKKRAQSAGGVEPASAEGAEAFCCYWPSAGDDSCSRCEVSNSSVTKATCKVAEANTWCEGEPNSAAIRKLRLPSAASLAGPPRRVSRRLRSDEGKAGAEAPGHGAAAAPDMCDHEGEENYRSPCKLDLANQIIAESAAVLKNQGGVLPISKTAEVALVGSEACHEEPLAIGGGSGWNGMACQEQPYVNVGDGIKGIDGVTPPSCPGAGGENSEAASADVVVIVVVPEKASEGTDRSTLQLEEKDVKLIKKYSKMGKPVVVVMNAPGPMITSTWDHGVDAILVTWLPGTQNGNGIAKALYGEKYEASGRLPFTFPKCSTAACSKHDEFDGSIPLGDQIKTGLDGKHWTLSDKALIGYRWYHAHGIEPNYPFGFGLFAYGSGSVNYTAIAATPRNDGATVQAVLAHDGPRAGKDVPQLYLKFPVSVPGDAAIRPEWVLKGFAKVLVEPKQPTAVTFTLTSRDLSYWDDSPGMSRWVCARGEFTACVGANARDAVANDRGPGCKTFTPQCSEFPGPRLQEVHVAPGAASTMIGRRKFLSGWHWPLPVAASTCWAAAAAAVAAVAAAAAAAQRLRRGCGAAAGAAAPGRRGSRGREAPGALPPHGDVSDREPLAGVTAVPGSGW